MSDAPAITIPRLDNEHPERYAARVIYVTMGAGRSLEAVRQKTGKKPATIRTLERWSSEDNWTEHAKRYDDQLAFITVQEAAAQYRRDLESHRDRYGKAGRRLYNAALVLLGACERAIMGTVIKGADGNDYPVPAMKLTPMALAVAMRSLTIAADLEAHALGVAELLPSLRSGDD